MNQPRWLTLLGILLLIWLWFSIGVGLAVLYN